MAKQKVNIKVVIWASIGIVSLVLSYFVNWLFLVLTLIAFIINQRELTKSSK